MLPEGLAAWLGALQGWLFQALVLPLVQTVGLSIYLDDAFDGTELFLHGVLEVALVVALLAPLQWLIPAERVDQRVSSRRDQRADVICTLIHRLGLVPLALFFTLRPSIDTLQAWLHLHDLPTLDLEGWWPGLASHPLWTFLLYLLVFDFVRYWLHRGQHAWQWWWALHALHHSQRRMTYWSDDRTHLLDHLITESVLAVVALAIGAAPAQYGAIVIGTRLLESLAHANVRISFGALGERLLVSPRFHRMHHAIAHAAADGTRGVNFAVLLPAWDLLFGTAELAGRPGPTGIADQLQGRDYGQGFWSQQWRGLARLATALGGPGPSTLQQHTDRASQSGIDPTKGEPTARPPAL